MTKKKTKIEVAPAPQAALAAAATPEDVVDDTSEGAPYLTVKDVLLAYTLRGAAGLDALPLASKSHLLRKAIAFCRVEGNEEVAAALVEHANKRGLVVWPGRGRGVPSEGATRSYKAQQIKGMDPFIRLPVAALGAKKGQVVTVAFRLGVIEVRAGA